MAKKPSAAEPITGEELAEFVYNTSDFGFEMKVLATLRGLGFDVPTPERIAIRSQTRSASTHPGNHRPRLAHPRPGCGM